MKQAEDQNAHFALETVSVSFPALTLAGESRLNKLKIETDTLRVRYLMYKMLLFVFLEPLYLRTAGMAFYRLESAHLRYRFSLGRYVPHICMFNSQQAWTLVLDIGNTFMCVYLPMHFCAAPWDMSEEI